MAEMSNFISIMCLTLKWTMLVKKVQKVFFSNLLKIKKWNSAAISTASTHFLGTQFSLNLWKNSLYIITKTHLGNQELKNQRHSIPFREDIFVSNHICASYLHKCMFVFPEKIFFLCSDTLLAISTPNVPKPSQKNEREYVLQLHSYFLD